MSGVGNLLQNILFTGDGQKTIGMRHQLLTSAKFTKMSFYPANNPPYAEPSGQTRHINQGNSPQPSRRDK